MCIHSSIYAMSENIPKKYLLSEVPPVVQLYWMSWSGSWDCFKKDLVQRTRHMEPNTQEGWYHVTITSLVAKNCVGKYIVTMQNTLDRPKVWLYFYELMKLLLLLETNWIATTV